MPKMCGGGGGNGGKRPPLWFSGGGLLVVGEWCPGGGRGAEGVEFGGTPITLGSCPSNVSVCIF